MHRVCVFQNECEQLVEDCDGIDLNNDDEKTMVETIYENALDDLSDDDKRLRKSRVYSALRRERDAPRRFVHV